MIGAKIKKLRNELGISQAELAKRISVSQQTIGSWETDRSEPNLDALKKLAGMFDTSVDYIVGNSKKRHYYDLTEKDEKDIQKQLESTLDDLSNEGTLSFMKNGGAEISDEDAELLKASLENVIRQSKIIAKKKFTPKKYRDSK